MPDPIAEYADFIPRIAIDLPECPDGVMLVYLQEAGRKFCEETNCWKEDIVVDAVADQTDYSLDTDYDAYIHEIVHVKVKNNSTDNFENLTELPANYYILVSDMTVRFNTANAPIASITDGIQVKAVMRPEYGSDELPTWMWDRYGEGILAYARWQLMKQMKKPWTSLELAMDNKRTFCNEVAQAKIDISKEFKSVSLRARYGRFR